MRYNSDNKVFEINCELKMTHLEQKRYKLRVIPKDCPSGRAVCKGSNSLDFILGS